MKERRSASVLILIYPDASDGIHYVEGCTAPTYSTASLHAAVVEIIAHEGAYMRYTTIQNWSDNVYNLVTKRAQAEKMRRWSGLMET